MTVVSSATLSGTEHHPHAAAVLGAALSQSAPSHAYLFHGPAGTGKGAVARAFAGELLAEGAADPESTRARVGRGAHPDLTWVTPSGAHELLVADIDEPVVAAATHTPFEARRRVFVVEAADTMNDEAGNRMLKTLEEPAAYAHLILLTDRPADVLPTIASRCQPVRFDPLPESEIVARLQRRAGRRARHRRGAAPARGGRALRPGGADRRHGRPPVERAARARAAPRRR